MSQVKSYAAETKGDLKITYRDGRVEIIPQCVADECAGAIVQQPREGDDDFVDLSEEGWAPICSGLMLTDDDPDDE